MHNKNDERGSSCFSIEAEAPQTTADQILQDILMWDDPKAILEDLREMMDAYFLYHDDLTHGEKEAVHCSYTALVGLLKQMIGWGERRAL